MTGTEQPPLRCSIDDLVERARRLAVPGRRALLGVAGPPGAGKSTLAAALADRLGRDVAVVGLDGFHLSDETLSTWGRSDRKGAPDTFDVAGYTHLLARLRDRSEGVVHVPRFDRVTDRVVGSAVPVPPDVPLVVTEGNYLLLSTPGWEAVRGLLDECWYLDVEQSARQHRLVARHVRYGKDPEQATRWVLDSDERNAELVEAARVRADLVVELTIPSS